MEWLYVILIILVIISIIRLLWPLLVLLFFVILLLILIGQFRGVRRLNRTFYNQDNDEEDSETFKPKNDNVIDVEFVEREVKDRDEH